MNIEIHDYAYKLGSMVAIATAMPLNMAKPKTTSNTTVSDRLSLPESSGVTPPIGAENILPARALGGSTHSGIKGLQQSKLG